MKVNVKDCEGTDHELPGLSKELLKVSALLSGGIMSVILKHNPRSSR